MKNCGGVFDLENKQKRLEELNKEIEQPGVWEDHKKVQALNQEKSHIEKSLEDWKGLSENVEELTLLLEMSRDEKDEKAFSHLKEDLNRLSQLLEKKEIQSFLGKENDINNSYLSIHAGSWRDRSCRLGSNSL